jgi:hypothetical protein
VEQLRAHPAATRVRAVLGISLFSRVKELRASLGLGNGDSNESGDLEYGEVDYLLLTLTRQQMLSSFVGDAIPFLLFETDAMWVTDAFRDLERMRDSMQAEQPGILWYVDNPPDHIGVGFYLVNSGAAEREWFSEWGKRMRGDMKAQLREAVLRGRVADVHEQSIAQKLVGSGWGRVVHTLLPVHKYGSGQWYQSHPTSDGLTAPAEEGVVVLNNNWIVGGPAKRARARTYGHWFLSAGGERCVAPQSAMMHAQRVNSVTLFLQVALLLLSSIVFWRFAPCNFRQDYRKRRY